MNGKSRNICSENRRNKCDKYSKYHFLFTYYLFAWLSTYQLSNKSVHTFLPDICHRNGWCGPVDQVPNGDRSSKRCWWLHNYTFGLYKQLKDCKKYRCTKKRTPEYKCPATAFVERDTNPPIVLRVENNHNHGADVLNKDVRLKENQHIKAAALAGKYFNY